MRLRQLNINRGELYYQLSQVRSTKAQVIAWRRQAPYEFIERIVDCTEMRESSIA